MPTKAPPLPVATHALKPRPPAKTRVRISDTSDHELIHVDKIKCDEYLARLDQIVSIYSDEWLCYNLNNLVS